MKKTYMKPNLEVIAVKTDGFLLTISGESLGNEQKGGEYPDYGREDNGYDW